MPALFRQVILLRTQGQLRSPGLHDEPTLGKALELPNGNDHRDWSPPTGQLNRRATLNLVDDTRQAIASLGN